MPRGRPVPPRPSGVLRVPLRVRAGQAARPAGGAAPAAAAPGHAETPLFDGRRAVFLVLPLLPRGAGPFLSRHADHATHAG